MMDDSVSGPTRQADLLPQHGGVQVRDVARVPSKRPLGVQSEGNGDRYVDGSRVVQQERDLSAGARLDAGHAHVLRRRGLIPAVLYGFVLRDAEVQLVEAQQERVPVLKGGQSERAGSQRLKTNAEALAPVDVHKAQVCSPDDAHLRQLRRFDLFDLEEVANGQEGDGHGADADHEDDQRWTTGDVAPQVLHRV